MLNEGNPLRCTGRVVRCPFGQIIIITWDRLELKPLCGSGVTKCGKEYHKPLVGPRGHPSIRSAWRIFHPPPLLSPVLRTARFSFGFATALTGQNPLTVRTH